jgi:hypothetical protein
MWSRLLSEIGRTKSRAVDNPLDLQLRTDSSLWIKECAINEGVRRFPPDWQYGGYVDGDFHFTRHDWALEAIHTLQHHSFVQLFSTYTDLTGETATSYRAIALTA